MNPIKDIKTLYETLFKNHPRCLYAGKPRFLPEELSLSRMIMMEEELYEYQNAINDKNMEEALDALVDLMVFVCGTIYLHGFTEIFQTAWKRVQEANLQKTVGNKNRETDCDLVKPKGWKLPTFGDLL